MNSKAIILFLAIVSVGGMGITSQAFADHHGGEQGVPLDFSTDSDTYDHSSVIEIEGAVSNTNRGADVTLVVSGPMGIVQVDQIAVSSDGSFSTTINTASAMMKYDGQYKILVTYFQEVNYFEYVDLVDGVALDQRLIMSTSDQEQQEYSEHHHEEVYDLASEVDYSISGGHVEALLLT